MAATERFLEASEELASRILDQELELNAAPSAEGINQLVDLYSKAIEYYEFRGDARYKNLQTRLQTFLARPDMQATLQCANSPPKPRHHKRVLSYDEQARNQRRVLVHEFTDSHGGRQADRLLSAFASQAQPSLQRLKRDFASQEAVLRRKLANRRAVSRSMCEASLCSLDVSGEVEAALERCFEEKTQRMAAVRVKYESQINELQGQGGVASLVVAKLTEQMRNELASVEAETTAVRLSELARLKTLYNFT